MKKIKNLSSICFLWVSYFLNLNKKIILIAICITLLLSSCFKSVVRNVGYQSLRTTFKQSNINKIPNDAEIVLLYSLSDKGKLVVTVVNRTDEIMIVDNTMSFYIENGHSFSYYDPTIESKTTTEWSSQENGVSVNLGAIGNALGIDGVLGTTLNGVNVSRSNNNGTSTANTTININQPRLSIGPHGSIIMPKKFHIKNFGNLFYADKLDSTIYTKDNSYCNFSVCISYSLDRGTSFKKIITDFYANSRIVLPLIHSGKVNETLRRVFEIKPDAMNENLWYIKFNDDSYSTFDSMSSKSFLFDYQ